MHTVFPYAGEHRRRTDKTTVLPDCCGAISVFCPAEATAQAGCSTCLKHVYRKCIWDSVNLDYRIHLITFKTFSQLYAVSVFLLAIYSRVVGIPLLPCSPQHVVNVFIRVFIKYQPYGLRTAFHTQPF